MKFSNFTLKPVPNNETEVDIYINGMLEYRLCLINRMHAERNFQIARPGRDGFRLDYRWTTHFDIVSRNLRNMVSEAMTPHCAPGGLDNVVEAVPGRSAVIDESKCKLSPKDASVIMLDMVSFFVGYVFATLLGALFILFFVTRPKRKDPVILCSHGHEDWSDCPVCGH